MKTANCISKIQKLGWNLVGDAKAASQVQKLLKDRLITYGRKGFLGRDDEAGWVACAIALTALDAGNYGVGALIVDDAENILAYGYNEICSPRFRSDAHAEMVVLSKFETQFPNQKKNGLTLYSSLEPCPMCYTRILISGIPKVVYVANDDTGGMVQRSKVMPEYWRAMESKCVFVRAAVGDELRHLAWDILMSNMDELSRSVKLNAREPYPRTAR